MRHYRRNADAGVRSRGRGAARGGVQAQAAWLTDRLRAGQLKPERVAMAAYLGHPVAKFLGISPPAHLRAEPWDYGSFSLELLGNGPVSPKVATLFAADCATRCLARHGTSHGESELVEESLRVIEAARAWVLGRMRENPEVAGNHLWSLTDMRRVRMRLRPDTGAFEAAYVTAVGCRKPPADVTKSVIRYTLSAERQAVFGAGRTQLDADEEGLDVARDAAESERQWQDAHFANALLAPEWPVVRI